MKRIINRIFAWAMALMLLTGAIASAAEITSEAFSISNLKVYSPEDPTAQSLQAFLEKYGVEYSISFVDESGNAVKRADDGKYYLEMNQTYTLSFITDEIDGDEGMPAGDYYLPFPKGLEGVTGGNTRVEGITWSYGEDGYLWFHVDRDDLAEVKLDASFNIRFTELLEDLAFGDYNVVIVEPEKPAEHPEVNKSGYNAEDTRAKMKSEFGVELAENEEYKYLFWSVEIKHPNELAGTIIQDVCTTDNWSFTSEDQARGLHIYATVGGVQHRVTVSPVTWDETSWSFTMPTSFNIDGVEIGLSNIEKLDIYYTGTIKESERVDPKVGERKEYGNQVITDADSPTAGAVRVGASMIGADVKKAVSANWGDNAKIDWTITVTIPGHVEGTAAVKWTLVDRVELIKDGSVVSYVIHNLMQHAEKITVTNDHGDDFSWAYEENTGTDAGKDSVVTMVFLCKNEKNEFTSEWTSPEEVTYTITYTFDRDYIEEYLYGAGGGEAGKEIAAGDITAVRNSASLRADGTTVDSSGKDADFPAPIQKEFVSRSEDGDTLRFRVTINEARRVYGTTSIRMHDEMTEGLSLIESSLVVKENGTRQLTKGTDYTVSTSAAQENVFDVTINTGSVDGNAMYTLEYDVSVDTDHVTNRKVQNAATITLFGVSRSASIDGDLGYDVNATAGRYIMNITKLSAYNNAKISGARFAFGVLGKPAKEDLITSGGVLTLSQSSTGVLLLQHRGYFVQEIEAPEGFMLDDSYHWFIFCRDLTPDCEKCDAVKKSIHAVDPGASIKIVGGPEVSVVEDGLTTVTGSLTVTNVPFVAYRPAILKEIVGRHPESDETFEFTIELAPGSETEGVTLPEKPATVNGEGTATVGDIVMTKPGNYRFTIQEKNGGSSKYAYDARRWTLELVVTQNDDGTLAVQNPAYTVDGGSAQPRATFRNVYRSGSLTVSKTVVPNGQALDANQAFAFTVTLSDGTVNGVYGGMTFVDGVATFTLKHGESLTATDLPADITYQVTEEAYAGYTTTSTNETGRIVMNETATAAFVNTMAPPPPPNVEQVYISVAGRKIWDDQDDAMGLRPEAVTIRLLRDGVVIDERNATAETGWQYSFDELPMYDERGRAYVYTVSEQPVSGYYAVVDGYDVTNHLLPDIPTPETNEPGEPLVGIARLGVPLANLEDLLYLFDYDIPLYGGLLGTGLEIPAYPFIFAGLGGLALIAVLVGGRRKRDKRS